MEFIFNNELLNENVQQSKKKTTFYLSQQCFFKNKMYLFVKLLHNK